MIEQRINDARQAVEGARSTYARLEAEEAATQAELESLQTRAGDEVLDDPDAANRLPREMQVLRDRIDITQRAVEAQRPRVRTAETAYLDAEADALEEPLRVATAALEAHQLRTQELLGELERHEGPFVPAIELMQVKRSSGYTDLPDRWQMPKSEGLRAAVQQAEVRLRVVRDMAQGVDPAVALSQGASFVDGSVAGLPIADCYPPCVWGPEALVPAPAYLTSMDRRRDQQASQEASVAATRQRVADLEAAIERGEVADRRVQDWTLGKTMPLPEQLEIARRQLAELEGAAQS